MIIILVLYTTVVCESTSNHCDCMDNVIRCEQSHDSTKFTNADALIYIIYTDVNECTSIHHSEAPPNPLTLSKQWVKKSCDSVCAIEYKSTGPTLTKHKPHFSTTLNDFNDCLQCERHVDIHIVW